MTEPEREQGGVQSVEVAGEVLKAILALRRPAMLGEIARAAGLHPSKAHRYLVSLARTGLVEQDAERGRYGPGALAAALGLMRLRSLDFVSCATPQLAALRDATGETSLLAMWSEQGPVVLKQEDSGRPIYLNVRVGSILPMRRSASGLVFAAFLPPERYRALLEREVGMEGAGTEDVERFLAAAAKVRETGLAQVDGSVVPGVRALAAPLFGVDGTLAAVIGLLGRDVDLDGDPAGPAARILLTAARAISEKLGDIAPER